MGGEQRCGFRTISCYELAHAGYALDGSLPVDTIFTCARNPSIYDGRFSCDKAGERCAAFMAAAARSPGLLRDLTIQIIYFYYNCLTRFPDVNGCGNRFPANT
jgi:hypothetical protein